MPRASKDTPHVQDAGVMVGRYAELDGYTVGFESFRKDADAAPMFVGLPDDRCQCPHWGYVVAGRITFRYGDRAEAYETGDAYYAPPGHVTQIAAGTELVEFSPTAELQAAMAVVERNLAAAAVGALLRTAGRAARPAVTSPRTRDDRWQRVDRCDPCGG